MSDWATAVGAVAGAVAGGSLALVGERLRAQARRRERWLDLRRELAVRFLDVTEQLRTWNRDLTHLLAANQTSGAQIGVAGVSSSQEAAAKVEEADTQVQALRTEIDIVGSKQERTAAKRLRDAVWAYATAYSEANAAPKDKAKEQQYNAANSEYLGAREAFQETVRGGLTGESRSRRLWHRLRRTA